MLYKILLSVSELMQNVMAIIFIENEGERFKTATIPSSEDPHISTKSISPLSSVHPSTTTPTTSISPSSISSTTNAASLATGGSSFESLSIPSTVLTPSISHPEHQDVSTTSTTLPSSSSAPSIEQHKHQTLTPVFSVAPRPFRPDRLATIDLIIVVIYLCLLISTSISTMIRTKKSIRRKAALAGNKAQATNNFLASGRKMNWLTVGASIFASNLGSEHFIGLSGSAAANGISVAAFELNALFILPLATWVFVPVLIVSKISTLPEYMQKRFGGKRIRTYLAVLSILLYIFTKISVNLFSGGIFLQQAIGWNLYSSAMFILALTCIMTLTGGLKGAMVIDNLQAIVMTTGASIVALKAMSAIGGWEGLQHRYSTAIPTKVPANLTHCAQPNPRAFQMLRPLQDRDMPWLGFIIGHSTAALAYWSADQMVVQRFLSARSLAHVQGSSVFAGYLRILPLVLMVIPGMISRCLYTDEVGCIDPIECQKYCQSSVSCSNTAYPRLVLELMPMGARGMMVAAMVAAIMGDLCNVFNSASALFSCDVWPLFRKKATQKEQETAGRVFVICLVFASIMWIPVIQEMQGGQLFIYIQAIAAMFAPPIAAVYVCAILSTKTNETGAFWSLIIGFLCGVMRMALSFMHKEPSCGQHIDDRPWLLKHVHYMYYAAFLFWFTIGNTLLISHYTKPPASFRLIRTTYWTRFDMGVRKDDKNVFEMKSSRKNSSNKRRRDENDYLRSMLTKTSDNMSDSDIYMSSKSSQQRLFTIEEKQEKRAADLSSVIVDINKEMSKESSKKPSPVTPTGGPKRVLQHQASLSASASAAVGVASEAGKFLANKLANEVSLKGAKEMVMAAATHLTGGTPNSRIKFTNLDGEEDDDDADEENENFESTMEEEDEDDSESEDTTSRSKRNRRSQSALSAALSSYKMKHKQKGGYKQAAYADDDDDEDDEQATLNKSTAYDKIAKDHFKIEGSSSEQTASPEPINSESGTRKASTKRSNKSSMKRSSSQRQFIKSPDESDDYEQGTGRTYKCLDNSVALLMKTHFEETILKIAFVAIILVGLGMFIIFSIPPPSAPKELVDILIKN